MTAAEIKALEDRYAPIRGDYEPYVSSAKLLTCDGQVKGAAEERKWEEWTGDKLKRQTLQPPWSETNQQVAQVSPPTFISAKRTFHSSEAAGRLNRFPSTVQRESGPLLGLSACVWLGQSCLSPF